MIRPILVPLYGALVAIGPWHCSPRERTRDQQTLFQIHAAFAAVGGYREEVGSLPPKLSDVCSHSSRFCTGDSGRRQFHDGWDRLVVYTRIEPEYEVRSLGADGALGTTDDLVLTSTTEPTFVSEVQGCYKLSGEWWDAFPGTVLTLDSTPVGPREYGVSPHIDHFNARWFPLPGQNIYVEWTYVGYASLWLRHVGDSLVGEAEYGGEGSSARVRPISARRITC